MKVTMTLAAFSVLFATCFANKGVNQNGMNLVLNEQELRFAGNALRTVLGNNVNAYRGQKGSRRFSGTFSIVEKENSCGDFDIRINADVELMNGNGNSNTNRNRYPNNNYTPISNNNNNNNYGPNNYGNAGRTGGYAGQYNY